MLPSDSWSTLPQEAEFLPPHNTKQPDRLTARDAGPIAVNDISQGLRARIWTLNYTGGDVVLAGHGALFSDAGVTELSLTFDQSGRPFVAYRTSGMVKIWWFDPIAGENAITDIAMGDQPFCHLDERRPELVGISDVLLIYRRGGSIYLRQQRDRFTIEYATPIVDAQNVTIDAWGLSAGNRMQIEYRAALEDV
jgi:hypothetical protein